MRRSLLLLVAACGGDPADVYGVCLDPPRGPVRLAFEDVTAASGVAFAYTTSDPLKGGGLAVVDLDGDDLPEIIGARREGGLALYRNLGGLRFELRPDSGLDPASAASAIGVADLDNDGDRDVVLAGRDHASVFANRGDGTFTLAARFEGAGTTEHVLPVDLDDDGLLDLYFSNYDVADVARSQNRLYVNRGGLAFAPPVLAGAGLSWAATAVDLDDDGDRDLYVANDTFAVDFGAPRAGDGNEVPAWPVDLVLRNDGLGADGGPRFSDIATAIGLAAPRSSMGGTLADLDDDGHLDLYVPDYGANKLFVRAAGEPFVDRAAALGVQATRREHDACPPTSRSVACLLLSWSALVADFDLDGLDEVMIVSGQTLPGDAPPIVLLERTGAGYREVAPNLACSDARGAVATDLDGDGDPDVVLAHRDGPLAIHETRGRPSAHEWIAFHLRGVASNREGLGAVVTIELASGRRRVAAVGAGGVVHTATSHPVRFGLRADDTIVRVDVAWPSGRHTSHPSLEPGTVVVLTEE